MSSLKRDQNVFKLASCSLSLLLQVSNVCYIFVRNFYLGAYHELK